MTPVYFIGRETRARELSLRLFWFLNVNQDSLATLYIPLFQPHGIQIFTKYIFKEKKYSGLRFCQNCRFIREQLALSTAGLARENSPGQRWTDYGSQSTACLCK